MSSDSGTRGPAGSTVTPRPAGEVLAGEVLTVAPGRDTGDTDDVSDLHHDRFEREADGEDRSAVVGDINPATVPGHNLLEQGEPEAAAVERAAGLGRPATRERRCRPGRVQAGSAV
nr:hypothetical protein [Frankia sp. CiP3]